jgi:TrpR-related protein YerC/YecD
MGKYSNQKKLTQGQQEELFLKFIGAIASLHNPTEAANFFKDLLSEQEVMMLARRLYIAELLDNGFTYEDICKTVQVSHATIARVQTWLSTFGDGYRTVIKRIKRTEPKVKTEHGKEWDRFKRKYPMYFWPQLLLREMVEHASTKEKKRILGVLDKLKEKNKLSRDLERFLKPGLKSHTT